MFKPPEISNAELAKIKPAALPEISRQAELKMEQILQTALASDQRASALSATYGAVAAGLIAAAAALDAIEHIEGAIVPALGIAAFGFFVATCLCAWACKPVLFFVSGNSPVSVLPTGADPDWMLRYYCRELDVRIAHNERKLARTAWWTTAAQAVTLASPVLSAAYYLAVSHPALLAAWGVRICG
jgi:hypothetical protein